jgi:peptide/nickel transport system permease protein
MDWWHIFKRNTLAYWGAILLMLLYLVAIAADGVAPYNPYASQPDSALLPPTQIYWRTPQGEWLGPHVYPTRQGQIDVETGDRKLVIDWQTPAPIRLWVEGDAYCWLPWPNFSALTNSTTPPKNKETACAHGGLASNRHLFGAIGTGRLHLMGTDDQARDQFSRLLHGSRISLSIGLVGIAISFPLGLLVGGLSGYLGGWIDAVIMRLTEVLMTIPSLYLLVALAAVLPPGLTSTQRFLLIVCITSLISWAGLARVIRGQVLSIKEQNYVQAAKTMGGNSLYILLRHILPQTTTYVIVSATLAIPSFIVAESVLSLIGLGIQKPDPSWGNLLSIASNASIIVLQPWLVWPPAIAVILTVLAFNLVGDGLRDALDPRNASRL